MKLVKIAVIVNWIELQNYDILCQKTDDLSNLFMQILIRDSNKKNYITVNLWISFNS